MNLDQSFFGLENGLGQLSQLKLGKPKPIDNCSLYFRPDLVVILDTSTIFLMILVFRIEIATMGCFLAVYPKSAIPNHMKSLQKLKTCFLGKEL